MGSRTLRQLVITSCVFGSLLATPRESKACFSWLRGLVNRCCHKEYTPPVPTACAPVQTTVQYIPETHYRNVTVNVPVTTYRPEVTGCDPCSGAVVTCMRPVTYEQPQVRQVPYTTYRLVYSTPAVVPAVVPALATVAPTCAPTCGVATCGTPSCGVATAPVSGCSTCGGATTFAPAATTVTRIDPSSAGVVVGAPSATYAAPGTPGMAAPGTVMPGTVTQSPSYAAPSQSYSPATNYGPAQPTYTPAPSGSVSIPGQPGQSVAGQSVPAPAVQNPTVQTPMVQGQATTGGATFAPNTGSGTVNSYQGSPGAVVDPSSRTPRPALKVETPTPLNQDQVSAGTDASSRIRVIPDSNTSSRMVNPASGPQTSNPDDRTTRLLPRAATEQEGHTQTISHPHTANPSWTAAPTSNYSSPTFSPRPMPSQRRPVDSSGWRATN